MVNALKPRVNVSHHDPDRTRRVGGVFTGGFGGCHFSLKIEWLNIFVRKGQENLELVLQDGSVGAIAMKAQNLHVFRQLESVRNCAKVKVLNM